MERKTKLICLLAVLLSMAILLSACTTVRKNIGGNITPAPSENDPIPTGSIAPTEATTAPTEAATAPTEAATAPTEAATVPVEETTAPTESAPQENTMSLGRIAGGTYTNTYVGFAIDLDSSWVFKGAEELQELPDNVAEMFAGSELGDAMNSLTQFIDMVAESAEDLASINVLYQQLTLQERLLYATMSHEDMIDSVLSASSSMIEAYNQAGFDFISMEKVTVSFLGEERAALKTSLSMQGIPYYTLQVFDHHLGAYSVTITFATFIEDHTEQLAALCYPIDK